MTETQLLKDLDVALKQFGTYNYYDKGVDEVFDASQAVAHVKTLTAKDAVEFLKNLSKHEHGEHLASHIVSCCDDVLHANWFDDVVEGCRAEGMEVY
jgi:hypothetical protein